MVRNHSALPKNQTTVHLRHEGQPRRRRQGRAPEVRFELSMALLYVSRSRSSLGDLLLMRVSNPSVAKSARFGGERNIKSPASLNFDALTRLLEANMLVDIYV